MANNGSSLPSDFKNAQESTAKKATAFHRSIRQDAFSIELFRDQIHLNSLLAVAAPQLELPAGDYLGLAIMDPNFVTIPTSVAMVRSIFGIPPETSNEMVMDCARQRANQSTDPKMVNSFLVWKAVLVCSDSNEKSEDFRKLDDWQYIKNVEKEEVEACAKRLFDANILELITKAEAVPWYYKPKSD